MAKFQLNNKYVSESSLLSCPQDSLKSVEEDYTSIFGDFDNSFLKGINVMYSSENINTPFSYDNVINNIFSDNNAAVSNEYDIYDEDESFSAFGFEC